MRQRQKKREMGGSEEEKGKRGEGGVGGGVTYHVPVLHTEREREECRRCPPLFHTAYRRGMFGLVHFGGTARSMYESVDRTAGLFPKN